MNKIIEKLINNIESLYYEFFIHFSFFFSHSLTYFYLIITNLNNFWLKNFL